MITLGRRYKDSITGFVGIAVSRTIYLNGCVRVGLEGRGKDLKIAKIYLERTRG